MRSGTKNKRHFFVTVVLVCFLLSAFVLPIPVYAAASQAQEDISQLLGNMRGPTGTAAQPIKGESARVSFEDGYLRALGAPANNYFPVSSVVAGNPTATAKNFIAERGAAFGIKSKAVDFTPKKSRKKNDHSYERFQQTYSLIPVFGAEVVIQLNASGGVEYAFSDIMRKTSELDDGKVSTTPTISAADAEILAIKLMAEKHPGLKLDSSDANLMIYHPAVVGNSGATRLVWQTVVVSVSVPIVNEFILIDAHTGEVALHYTQIMDALNRQIYDSNNTAADPGTLMRSEGGPATGITDVDTCYDYFRDTYNFYFNEHGRDSIDNAGMTLSSTVRFCPYYPDYCPYQNAFWDGSRMYFGLGFVADDVTAHELTHGVTQYESGLIYMNESGAINESFSDMWGEWVDLTNGAGNDSPSVRWLIGEDIAGMGAIRNMANPPQFGDPDRKGSPLWYWGAGDNGGVHINSGVGNKLCYLLTDGNTFNGKTVTGMGISATADLFYEVQTHLLTSGADYADLHDALTQAAINLGWSDANKANLENACLATELSYSPPVPSNDECVNAICVEDGIPVNGTTIAATGTDITSCASGDTADVWYSYTPAVSGSVTISMCGSSYDTTLAVFNACGGTELACNDDYCELSSQITTNLTAGVTYLIRVSGYGGDEGDFVITVTGGQGGCGPRPPFAQTGSTSTQFNTSVLITLVATDDGLPNPPGDLNYIITSLPSHGALSDPCASGINSIPYTLAGNGNNVIYTPATGYAGFDNFTFKANDGGVPPDGGDSNTATFLITVSGCTPAPILANPGPPNEATNVPINAILRWNGSPTLQNGGFETGNFTGWTTVTGPGYAQLEPWTLATVDSGPFHNGVPFEGTYFAQNGFDGIAGLFYDIYKEVAIPAGTTSVQLEWSERLQWDTTLGATIARPYEVTLRPAGGGSPLALLFSTTLPPGTTGDTGYVTHSVDLLAAAPGIAGQTIRINFHEFIPETFTGPAQFDLDGISLTLFDSFSVKKVELGQPSYNKAPHLVGASSSGFTSKDRSAYLAMKEKALASKAVDDANSGTPVNTRQQLDTVFPINVSQPTKTVTHLVDGAASVLVFDDYQLTGSFAQDALNNLGLGFVDVGGDQVAFDTQMDTGIWDLVIYDMAGTSINQSSKNRIMSYIASGGRVLMFWWDMDSDAALAAAFEAAVVADIFSPLPVYGVTPLHSVWTTPNIVNLPLDDTIDVMNDDGDILRPIGGGVILGSFTAGGGTTNNEAMILGNSGRTILHGFSPDEVGYLDGDGSGKIDRVELYENEISFLLGSNPSPATYDVYFDTVNPPVTLIHSGLTGTSCEPVPYPLACGTTYYWQVVATNLSGCQTIGPVWSFTTTTFTGDLDHNCRVDFEDFAIMGQEWHTSGIKADIYKDGNNRVDLMDLAVLADEWLEQ